MLILKKFEEDENKNKDIELVEIKIDKKIPFLDGNPFSSNYFFFPGQQIFQIPQNLETPQEYRSASRLSNILMFILNTMLLVFASIVFRQSMDMNFFH